MAELTDRAVALLRVRRVSILLMAGRGEGYGAGLGVAEGRELERGEALWTEVFGGITGSSGASTELTVSICSPGSGWSWLMLISRLKRNSPLLGLVRLTALHVWLPLWPLRVALPVRLNVFSHSSNESPLEDSAPGSAPPIKKKKYIKKKGQHLI